MNANTIAEALAGEIVLKRAGIGAKEPSLN
jgi:hypothetical protein